MMLFFYNLLVLLLFPIWLFLLWKRQRPHFRISERMGFYPRSLKNPVWIHGVSLGEVKLAIKLANILKKKGFEVFLTTTTKAGASQLEKEGFPFAMFPVDFYLFQKLAVCRLEPKAVILMETEIWPSLFNVLRKKKAACFIVNGRISDRKLSSYLKFRSIFREALKSCFVSASSAENLERFISLGADRNFSAVQSSMKFDVAGTEHPDIPKDLQCAMRGFLPESGLPVWIAGSVREGEEELFLKSHVSIKKEEKDAKMIFAPRHLTGIGSILEKCWKLGLRPKLRSEIPDKEWDVLIVDTYGELQNIYSFARVAFIGGSILDYGGQNPLEPAALGIPVLFGKHMENFAEEAEELVRCGGARTIDDTEKIPEAVIALFKDNVQVQIMRANALNLVNKTKGASEATVDWILEKL